LSRLARITVAAPTYSSARDPASDVGTLISSSVANAAHTAAALICERSDMSQSALERIQDLERQKLAIIAEAEAAAVARISDALEELKALVREHLKAAGAPRR
jgi:hypothetical protein